MSAVAEARYSAADLLKLPDGDRFELVNGELVENNMSYESSYIATRLASRLSVYCDDKNLGWVNGPDAMFRCYEEAFPDDPDRVRKPDVSFIQLDRFPAEDFQQGYCTVVPDFVAEVISPNDTYYEVREKTEEYLRVGVQLVWVVDPHTRSVQVHRADGSTDEFHESQELSGETVVPGFRLSVAELFRVPVAPAKT